MLALLYDESVDDKWAAARIFFCNNQSPDKRY